MQAIETVWKGYRFRSRLEARWAVFFDALGLQWEYEPEGFDLGAAGWYLPDFRVQDDGWVHWYEVKPKESPIDLKLKAFRAVLGCHSESHMNWNSMTHAWQINGDPVDACWTMRIFKDFDLTNNAALKARSARFEHGEQP